jgi:hypothetical protein
VVVVAGGCVVCVGSVVAGKSVVVVSSIVDVDEPPIDVVELSAASPPPQEAIRPRTAI